MRTRHLVAVAAAGLLLAGLVSVVRTPAAARAADVPGTSCSVFPANNVWNADISSLPVNTHSAAWLNSTGANSGRLLHPDFGGPPYGIPFNVVDNTHATATFTFQYASESDGGPYPYGSDLQVEAGSDAHMLTINSDTCKLYETFATDYNGPHTAGSGAIFDLTSNALRTDGWTSADAAGLPIFPGLVRLDEVSAGFIGHAIRFTVQRSDQSHLWPARHDAGSTTGLTDPPMGARFRLKSTYDISGFHTAAKVVLQAMKTYGLIVADNGSNWFFQGTEDAGWDAGPYPQMISELKTIPANQFEAIDESSLMVDPNSAVTGVPGPPTNVSGTNLTASSQVSWTAPANPGASAITSYVVTASDGCTVQGSMTVSAPSTTVLFTGLNSGSTYTFTVAAVNSYGSGPPSAASGIVLPSGTESWVGRCSAKQFSFKGSNGVSWTTMDSSLVAPFTAPANSWAIITANADLFTANAGYNQDIGINLDGSVIAWKESGGFAGTFSPNAATVQTAVQLGGSHIAYIVWKANRYDPGTIFAGAGPIGGAFSPTRITVQFVPQASGLVFTAPLIAQLKLTGSNGSTWKDMDATNLSLDLAPPSGSWTAYVTGNADLWTSTAGYNQDLALNVDGSVVAWKESGGYAGTFSPNAAFVEAALTGPFTGGTHHTVKLQWKANRSDPGSIWAGAGSSPTFSPTSLTVILAPALAATTGSLQQYSSANSDGATWKSVDGTNLKWTLAPGSDGDYMVSAGADLWTSVAGYNQDLGLMVSGGAYGSGTVVAWKESGGFAGTYSPNAAFVTTDLDLQGGQSYDVSLVWKANRSAAAPNAIWAGAGPIGGNFSPTTLIAEQLA